jgi:hypothetical protein
MTQLSKNDQALIKSTLKDLSKDLIQYKLPRYKKLAILKEAEMDMVSEILDEQRQGQLAGFCFCYYPEHDALQYFALRL